MTQNKVRRNAPSLEYAGQPDLHRQQGGLREIGLRKGRRLREHVGKRNAQNRVCIGDGPRKDA